MSECVSFSIPVLLLPLLLCQDRGIDDGARRWRDKVVREAAVEERPAVADLVVLGLAHVRRDLRELVRDPRARRVVVDRRGTAVVVAPAASTEGGGSIGMRSTKLGRSGSAIVDVCGGWGVVGGFVVVVEYRCVYE